MFCGTKQPKAHDCCCTAHRSVSLQPVYSGGTWVYVCLSTAFIFLTITENVSLLYNRMRSNTYSDVQKSQVIPLSHFSLIMSQPVLYASKGVLNNGLQGFDNPFLFCFVWTLAAAPFKSSTWSFSEKYFFTKLTRESFRQVKKKKKTPTLNGGTSVVLTHNILGK